VTRARQEVLMVVDFTVVRDPAARGWITICLIVPCAWRSFRSWPAARNR